MNVDRFCRQLFSAALWFACCGTTGAQQANEWTVLRFPETTRTAPVDPVARDNRLWHYIHPLQDPLGAEPPALDLAPPRPGPFARPVPLICDDPEPPAPMTLAQAVDFALCRNPQIRLAWAEIKVRASGLGQARAAYLPTLSATVNRLDDKTHYPDSEFPDTHKKSTRRYANFNWRVLDFGTRAANLEAAQRQITAALYSRNGAVMHVTLETVQAWYEAQIARAALQARRHMRDLTEKTLLSALRRQGRGVGSETDTLQAESALARARLELNRAQGALEEAVAMLVYTLGLPPTTKLTLNDDMADYTGTPSHASMRALHAEQVSRGLDVWLEAARRHNPDIAASRAEWSAALERVRAAQAKGLPTFDFSFGYYDNGRPTDGATGYRSRERMLGLSVTIPIFDGFGHTYRVRQAQAEAEQTRLHHEDTAHQTLRDIVRIHSQARTAWNTLDAAESLRASADKAALSLLRQFEYGTADILRLTQAQQDLAQADIERINA